MNVAVLTSPLQIFNFLEYLHGFSTLGAETRWEVILPIEQNYPKGLGPIGDRLQKEGACRIHLFRGLPGDKKNFRKPIKRVLLARKYVRAIQGILGSCKAVETLVVGDYRSRECRHVMACCRGVRGVLLDDGSATHQISSYLSSDSDARLAPMFPTMDLHGILLYAGGVRLRRGGVSALFSHYLPSVESLGSVIPHEYAYWRSRVEARDYQRSKDILFLGMSHVESGIALEGDYLKSLRRIRGFYGQKRVLYKPHRKESRMRLSSIEALGYELLEPDVTPVEYMLMQADVLPAEVSSMASSSLDNMPLIFRKNLACRCFVPFKGYCRGEMEPHFNQILEYHIQHSSQKGLNISDLSKEPFGVG